MSQPLIRTALTHDPSSMSGQAYLPQILFFKVSVTGSGPVDVYTFAPGTYVQEVTGRISTALDAGTVDVGDEDSASKFIANSEWTETNLNALASSRQTTAPDGAYYTAHKWLRVTVGGAATEGEIELMVTMFNLVSMEAQGFHNEVTVP